MAFTPGEETVLKALVVKLVQRRQATNNIPAKRVALDTILQNRQAAIDAAKISTTHNGTTEETIDPATLAIINATFNLQIAAAQSDLQNTIDNSQSDIIP